MVKGDVIVVAGDKNGPKGVETDGKIKVAG